MTKSEKAVKNAINIPNYLVFYVYSIKHLVILNLANNEIYFVVTNR